MHASTSHYLNSIGTANVSAFETMTADVGAWRDAKWRRQWYQLQHRHGFKYKDRAGDHAAHYHQWRERRGYQELQPRDDSGSVLLERLRGPRAGMDYEAATASRYVELAQQYAKHMQAARVKEGATQLIAKEEAERRANQFLISLEARQAVLRRHDLDMTADDEDLRAWADSKAAICRGICMEPGSHDLLKHAACVAIVERYGFTPPDAKKLELPGILARLVEPVWWRRQVLKESLRAVENLAVAMGQVNRDGHVYVSRYTRAKLASRRERCRHLLDNMEAENQHGESYSLAELAQLGVSNPWIRRSELMVRINGFEKCSRWLGHVGMFYTHTAPSEYHSNSDHYAGHTPRDGQQYLTGLFSRIRTEIARLAEWHDAKTGFIKFTTQGKIQKKRNFRRAIAGLAPIQKNARYVRIRDAFLRECEFIHTTRLLAGVKLYGFRVTEPHNDGCPHWHLLVFMPPEVEPYITLLMFKHAFSQGMEDVMRYPERWRKARVIDARFDIEAIDPEKGSAVGYIAKYISKNIDGKRMGEGAEDIDAADKKSNGKAEENAAAIRDWASAHGNRQFAQYGGPPVGLWREIRKLDQEADDDYMSADHDAHVQLWRRFSPDNFQLEQEEYVDTARRLSQANDWAAFTMLMGGVTVRRKDMRLKVAKWCYSAVGEYRVDTDTGEIMKEEGVVMEPERKTNRYGDTIERVLGVVCDGEHQYLTRPNVWTISKKPREIPETIKAAIGGDDVRLRVSVEVILSDIAKNRRAQRDRRFFPPPPAAGGFDAGAPAWLSESYQ
jgi:hypothetical protein